MRRRSRWEGNNPNHNLWNNNGTWWIHLTVYPTPVTKVRVHRSLQTKDVLEARRRRDAQVVNGALSARRSVLVEGTESATMCT